MGNIGAKERKKDNNFVRKVGECKTVYKILALDIGEQRTGVAIANSIARIASPLTTLTQPEQLIQGILSLIEDNEIEVLVVGLPRSLQGTDTAQTAYVRDIAEQLEKASSLPIHFIDEALTSVKAEHELKARKKPYQKEDVDMLAATYILEDFLTTNPEVTSV